MASNKRNANPQAQVGALTELIRNARLTWRLLQDRRVPMWIKAIVPASLLYLIFPIDIIPDAFLGLGQLDDLAIILMAVKLFHNLVPPALVREHLDEMSSVQGSSRVVDEEEESGAGTTYLEGRYRVVDDK